MGFKRDKTYRLVFADPEFEGLEVRARSVPTGQFLKITELMGLKDSGGFTAEDKDKITELFATFADALIDWNLEDDEKDESGQRTGRDIPVPATLAGLLTQDLDFVLDIIKAWMDAVTTVPDAVGKASPSGVTYPEGLIPMDPLSSARLSLSAQS